MRLIDADEYRNKITEYLENDDETVEILDAMPTIDAVPVVRCEDCIHHTDEEPGMVYCPAVIGGWVSNDFFCGDGERKEE